MYRSNVVDVSTARKNLSKILDRVFFNNESVVIIKRNIPLVRITKVVSSGRAKLGERKVVDLSLFGVLRKDKRSAATIAVDLRRKTWR